MKPLQLFLALLFALSCAPSPRTERSSLPVIPRPVAVEMGTGAFRVGPGTSVFVGSNDTSFTHVAEMLAGLLRRSSGWEFPVRSGSVRDGAISFKQTDDIRHEEGYRLTVTAERIVIESRTSAGAFYGMQTVRQLLPPEIEGDVRKVADWSIPSTVINDAPRYAYRGMHLDVARHFFPAEFVKRYIDLLAMHKMNRFHWHLTDDQGWRIEIKRYPKLTEVGAWRNGTLIGHYSDQPHRFDTVRYGGFYSQDEIREVVRYAQERFVTIVPEIEMPGHALAALTAYPHLSCTGGPFEVQKLWGVFDDVFCTTDTVFTFLEGVLTEVMDLFPGTYIHVGGDEVPKTRWAACPRCSTTKAREGLKDDHELQSYCIRRMERFLSSHGRRLIGWDEILEGGLAPGATVMSWRGTEGGIAAARLRHDVIMTPGSHCYFDHYQSRSPEEPIAIGGFTPLEKVYAYEPTPAELTPDEAKHILGAQGNVWTEYILNGRHVEYMAYPRAIALAEVLWSSAPLRDFDDFADRLSKHTARLDRLGVNYANHLFDVRAVIGPATHGVTLSLSSRDPQVVVRYTTDGSDPAPNSAQVEGPITVTADLDVRAAGFKEDRRSTRITRTPFAIHAAAGKPISLATPPHGSYSVGGRQALVNGVPASSDRYGDGEWLGWSGADLDATIDLLEPRKISAVAFRFFNGIGQWIWLPRSVEVQVSVDGASYRTVGTWDRFDHATTAKVVPVELTITTTEARFMRAIVRRYGAIPAGSPGAGNQAWLFVDELMVR
ncbi:MAG: family 20 glycosylhydrolase [Bacteroidetes bacterium]|jgi:hexosaminidase|nr:family 20 glycosylhydrolase [Bacteroidota bacterium]